RPGSVLGDRGCRSQCGCPRRWCEAHIWPALPRSPQGPGEAQEGYAQPNVAVPSQLDTTCWHEQGSRGMDIEVARVVIGMDPHKRSVTIEVMTGDESVVGGGRFATDAEGYARLLAY